MHQMPNSPSGPVGGPQAPLQQSQPPRGQPPARPPLDQGAMQGPGGRKPGPQGQNPNQSSGWTSGPIPGCSDGGVGGAGAEPSGWEEPSPQSISRKNEIDDGTSAWGDPTHYNYKPVNLWDKNSAGAAPGGQQPPLLQHSQGPVQPPPQQQQAPQAPPQQQGAPPIQQQPGRHNRDFNTGHGPGKTTALGETVKTLSAQCTNDKSENIVCFSKAKIGS